MLSQSQWLAINGLILLIYQTEDLKMMRRYFLDAMGLIVPYDKAGFYLFSEEANGKIIMQQPVCKNLSDAVVKEYEQLINSDISARRVINLRRTTAYRSSDLIQPARGCSENFIEMNQEFWYSGIIMNDKERLLGEMILYRNKKKANFSDTEVEVLDVVKEHLALRLLHENPREDISDIRVSPLAELGFTERECEIAELLTQQFSIKEISAKLVISPYTTKKHISHIYGKLQVKNRLQFLDVVRQCEKKR